MKRGEVLRRLISTFLYLSVLRFLLVHNATNYDSTEVLTLWEMTAVVVLCEGMLWFAMRERGGGRQGRARWTMAFVALVLIATGCIVRPNSSVVRASSYERLVMLSEINRW